MRARGRAHAREEAVVGQHDADVRERRLGDDRGDVLRREDPLERVEVVERDEPGVGRRARVQTEQTGRAVLLVAGHERVVEVAVVVAAEDDDDRSPGAVTREPDRLGVGARGGQRELPAGQVVAVGEQSRRLDALLDREQELHAARGAVRDRRDHGGRREAAARGQVGLVEVDVRVPVDVGEPAALAVRDVDRPVLVEPGHPRHRHAVGHQRPCARGQRGRSARALLEPRTLARMHLAEPGAVDRGRGHGRQHDGRGVP